MTQHRAGVLTSDKNITITNTGKPTYKTIYARVTPQDMIVTVRQGSNDLEIIDLNLKKRVDLLKGYPEPDYKFDKFRALRHAKEDQFPLWRKGQDAIVLLNPQTFQPQAEFRNFWPQEFTPMFFNISPPQKKILGYSLSTRGGILTILSNYTQPNGTRTDFIKIPASETWAGMEQNNDASLTIVAVQSKIPNKPHHLKMIAYDTTNIKLNVVTSMDFNESKFSAVQFMRKVKGYEIFVIACRNSLAIIGYSQG